MKTYLYETLSVHVRIDIMLVNGRWFYAYHGSYLVTSLTTIDNNSGKTINECEVAPLIALIEGWKLIGEIK